MASVNVCFAQKASKAKAPKNQISGPIITYDSVRSYNGSVFAIPAKITEYDYATKRYVSRNIRNHNDSIFIKWIQPNRTSIAIRHKDSPYNSTSQYQYAIISYPDGSFYEGEYGATYKGDLLDSIKFVDGTLNYKNGDKYIISKKHNGYAHVQLANIEPKTYVVENYEFTLPAKTIPLSVDNIITTLNNQMNEQNPNPAVKYEDVIKEGLIDPAFWISHDYPSVLAMKNLDKVSKEINAQIAKEEAARETLRALPQEKYSGLYAVSPIGQCTADYTFKTLDNIRYKDGKIHCYLPAQNSTTATSTSKSSTDLYGTYDNGKRIGDWKYIHKIYKKNRYDQGVKRTETYQVEDARDGIYKDNKREGKWVVKKFSNQSVLRDNITNFTIDSVYSTANFENGVFVGEFLYRSYYHKKDYNQNIGTQKIIKGKFSDKGVMVGDWTIEIVKYRDEQISSHLIETYVFDHEGFITCFRMFGPQTGAYFNITPNGVEKGNTDYNLSRDELNKYNKLFNTNITRLYPVPIYNRFDEYDDDLFNALNMWMSKFAKMNLTQDDEDQCKYYSRQIY